MIYTKEFLVNAFASRFTPLGDKAVADAWCMAWDFYDSVTKEDFRKYASLDAKALKEYLSVGLRG